MIDDLLWWTTALTTARKVCPPTCGGKLMSDIRGHDKTVTRAQTATVVTQSPLSPRRQTDPRAESRRRSTMNVALWIVQGLLAALFLFAGGAKLVLPLDQMAGPVAPG